MLLRWHVSFCVILTSDLPHHGNMIQKSIKHVLNFKQINKSIAIQQKNVLK